jgi:high-affinity Fe2+/Pb2+ permease
MFSTPEIRARNNNDRSVTYYSPHRIDRLINAIITSIILGLLIAPVGVFYAMALKGKEPNAVEGIGILMIFALLFSGAMSLLTGAKRHEVLGAAAAYCAVLVVFLGNYNFGTARSIQRVSNWS